MKTLISILKWINRILIIPFLVSLLISSVDSNYFFYSMYIAFALGCFQVFSSVMTCLYLKKIRIEVRKFILIYISMVVLYFVGFYVLSELYGLFIRELFFRIIVVSIPVILSLFWTYIIESINKEI